MLLKIVSAFYLRHVPRAPFWSQVIHDEGGAFALNAFPQTIRVVGVDLWHCAREDVETEQGEFL